MMTVSEALALAFQSYQTGQLNQAEFICQQILQVQPNCAEALQLLGVMAHQVGKLPEAIFYYQQIVTLRPDQADTYYSLGAALHQQGQLEAAIAQYQQVIALQPGFAHVYYDLGNALQQQGQLEAAIQHYQQAIALSPSDSEAHANLANALLKQGQTEAAIAHYQQSIALRPGSSGVHYNLGNAFVKQGSYGEAIIQYQQALALEPQYLDAYLGLGRALLYEHQLEQATACFQQAIVLNSNRPEAYQNLGVALTNQDQVDEAIASFQKALELKPDFVEAYWQRQLILPILCDTQEQMLVWRQRFCRGLNDLIQQTTLDTPDNRKRALIGLERSALPFYLGYQGLNDRGIQRKYGKFIHQVMAANYPEWVNSPMTRLKATPVKAPVPSLSKLNHTEKIRVGYLSAHFRQHTVAKLTIGWLKNCDRQKFEIYSYYLGHQVDFLTEQFRSCSDYFYHIYSNLEAVCQQIIADKLHVLVFTDIGMDTQTTQIAALQLVPWQCTTWGHPITSGLPTIDYYLSSDLMEPENAQKHYSEKLILLPNIGMCYEKPAIPESTKSRSDFHLREDAIVYLSCQSLFKYIPQFDYIFAKIAQRVPRSQFVFISHHVTPFVTVKFQARLQRAFANLSLNSEDYCVFLPKQSQADYLQLNLVSDIFLDTCGWSGGNTTLEAIACGLPVVTCPGDLMRSRHSYGILQMLGVTETIARDEAEYVNIATRLGLEPGWRQQVARKIYERHSWLYDDTTCVTALESFYKGLVQL